MTLEWISTRKVVAIEKIAVIGKVCQKKLPVPAVLALPSAHKKTVVIRPQMHNGFQPSTCVSAISLLVTSTTIAAIANTRSFEFG